MYYQLAYGHTQLSIELPEKNVIKVLGIKEGQPLSDPMDEVRQKLTHPNSAEPLAVIAKGKKSACIVVCDITRPVPNKIILPPILQTLNDAGVPDSGIVILVATGLHRPSTAEEKIEMLGENIVQNYRVEDHYAKNLDAHTYLGESDGKIPVWIDNRYMQAEIKILTGLIEPHFMAGWSGGRKLIIPGIAAAETICPWHSPRFLEHSNARFGCIDGNPVHTEQMEIARKAGCDFIVNVVIDHHRNILAVVAGEMNEAHLEGVQFARKYVVDKVPQPVDIVITSAAGYPLDKTWYQTIKGIVGAIDIVKPGGTIIIASACDEGIGSKEFAEMVLPFKSTDEFMAAISEKFLMVDQWQVEELAKALRKAKVKVVSGGLPNEVFRRYFVEPYRSVEEAVTDAMQEYGQTATIAVLPDGPYILAEL